MSRALRLTTPREFPTYATQLWSRATLFAQKHFALVVTACLISASLVWVATRQGVGLSPDSLQYLEASESVVAGQGLTTIGWDGQRIPLTHYPPAYPLLLSAGSWLGLSFETTARVSNVVLFAATLVLIGLIVRRIAPHPSWAAPAAVFVAALTHDLVVVHSMAWSEPLYLTLTLGGLFALALALDRHSLPLLILAAAAAAAASVVRYVGVANIGVVGLVTLLWWRSNKWMRLGTPAMLSLVMVLPLLTTLLLGARGNGGAVANRRFGWHPLEWMDVEIAASVVGHWITPLDDAGLLSVAWLFAISVLALSMLYLRTRQAAPSDLSPQGKSLTRILLLYAVLYIAVVALSMTVVDAQTTFEPRMLVPVLAVAIIVTVTWLARQSRRGEFVRLAAAAIIALVVSANTLRWIPWLRDAQRYGLGLRRVDSRGLDLVHSARHLPPTAQVYSNDPYYLRVHTPYVAAGLPRQLDPNSLLPNARHDEQVQEICEMAATRPTYVVLFDDPMSGDSTARADAATQSGAVTRLSAGSIVRVRAGCGSRGSRGQTP
jgi:hypothetical protein